MPDGRLPRNSVRFKSATAYGILIGRTWQFESATEL